MKNILREGRERAPWLRWLAVILIVTATYDLIDSASQGRDIGIMVASCLAFLATVIPGIGFLLTKDPRASKKWFAAMIVGVLTTMIVKRAFIE